MSATVSRGRWVWGQTSSFFSHRARDYHLVKQSIDRRVMNPHVGFQELRGWFKPMVHIATRVHQIAHELKGTLLLRPASGEHYTYKQSLGVAADIVACSLWPPPVALHGMTLARPLTRVGEKQIPDLGAHMSRVCAESKTFSAVPFAVGSDC